MTITSAHALYSKSSNGVATLSVTASAVGDLWVVYVGVGSATVSCTGVSGGNATGWTNAVANWVDTFTIGQSLWIGTMTSTGSATITATFSGSISGITVDIDAQPFHSSLASPSWGIESAGHQNNTPASTTVTWPTLTPTVGLTDLYWGRAGTNGTGSSPTSGYTLTTDVDGNLVIYDPGVTGAQSPTCTQTSSRSAVSAVLIKEATAVTVNAGLASASAVALGATAAIGNSVGLAQGVGAVPATGGAVSVNVGLPHASATALGPTTNAGANAPAALASAVASGLGATVAAAPGAGSAHASGAVPATSGGVGVNAGRAQASGSALVARVGLANSVGLAHAAVAALGSVIGIAPGAGLAHAGGLPQQVRATGLVPAINRTAYVAPEGRDVIVGAEVRTAAALPEIRTVKVTQQGG